MPLYFPCSFQQSTHVDLAASELLAPLRVPVSHSARLGITSGKFGELDLLPVLSSDRMNSSKVRTCVLALLSEQASCHLSPQCIFFHNSLISQGELTRVRKRPKGGTSFQMRKHFPTEETNSAGIRQIAESTGKNVFPRPRNRRQVIPPRMCPKL